MNEQIKVPAGKKLISHYNNGQQCSNKVLLSEIEEIMNSNKSIEDGQNCKNTMLDLNQNQGIKIPESVSMEAQIPFLDQSKNIGKEIDKNESMNSETPFNFHLEKYDSLMMVT